MDCWEALGIRPTADIREIKRAYAARLKITRPDEDAQAYQQLREAFDYALAIAPYYADAAEEAQFSDTEVEEQALPDVPSIQVAPDTSLPVTVTSVQQRVFDLYRKGGGRALWRLWPSLHQQIESMTEHDRHEMRDFLVVFMQQHFALPKKLVRTWWQYCQISPTTAKTMLHEAAETSLLSSPRTDLFDDNVGVAEILALMKRAYAQGDEAALWIQWPTIRRKLDKLPLEEAGRASAEILDFARQYRIYSYDLWAEWALYFDWLTDHHHVYFDLDELEAIQKRVSLTRIFKPENAAQRPMSAALKNQLQKQPLSLLRYLWILLMGFILWPYWRKELDDETVWKLSNYSPHHDIYNLQARAGFWRNVMRIGLPLFLLYVVLPNHKQQLIPPLGMLSGFGLMIMLTWGLSLALLLVSTIFLVKTGVWYKPQWFDLLILRHHAACERFTARHGLWKKPLKLWYWVFDLLVEIVRIPLRVWALMQNGYYIEMFEIGLLVLFILTLLPSVASVLVYPIIVILYRLQDKLRQAFLTRHLIAM